MAILEQTGPEIPKSAALRWPSSPPPRPARKGEAHNSNAAPPHSLAATAGREGRSSWRTGQPSRQRQNRGAYLEVPSRSRQIDDPQERARRRHAQEASQCCAGAPLGTHLATESPTLPGRSNPRPPRSVREGTRDSHQDHKAAQILLEGRRWRTPAAAVVGEAPLAFALSLWKPIFMVLSAYNKVFNVYYFSSQSSHQVNVMLAAESM
jgi:hypothetical protein